MRSKFLQVFFISFLFLNFSLAKEKEKEKKKANEKEKGKISLFYRSKLMAQIQMNRWRLSFKKGPKIFRVRNHPNYGRSLNYIGYTVKDLEREFGFSISDKDVVVVTCLDGYRPILKGSFFLNKGAFLAFEEKAPLKSLISDDKKWTKLKMEDEFVSPGPAFLVWPDGRKNKHTWPYQIVKIEVISKTQFGDFEAIAPEKKDGADIFLGYSLFKKNCMKCHSLLYKGPRGKAPDLAYVTRYRTKSYIKKRIRGGRGKMPSFSKKKLSDRDIENLISYLEVIGPEVEEREK